MRVSSGDENHILLGVEFPCARHVTDLGWRRAAFVFVWAAQPAGGVVHLCITFYLWTGGGQSHHHVSSCQM